MPQELNTALIEDELRRESQQPCGKLQWLDESYQNPEEFCRTLKSTCDARFAMQGVSSLYTRYNFFHDIIVRNRDNSAPALCWRDMAEGLSEISYSDLGKKSGQKASLWGHLGLEPGQTLCIIRPMGLELVVDLLAALMTGCRISVLPPQGKGFLKRRLEVLNPDHISIDKQHISLVPEWHKQMLSETRTGKDPLPEQKTFYAYASEEVVFGCFDPCSPTPWLPVDITSDAAYMCAMRDGIIGLGLGPGKVYAAPGFHFLETQPALLLAGFFCGATYLHLLPKDVADNPELVVQMPIRAFGVSQQVRDMLRENPVDAGNSWECWFRNTSESCDMEQWQQFIRDLNLKNAFAFNMKWNTSTGGGSLYSIRRKGMAHMNVLPVPGSTWALGDLSGGGEAIGDSGTFCLASPGVQEGESVATTSLIIGNSGEWTFAGTTINNREGRSYPAEEVLETLGNMRAHVPFWFSITAVPLMDPASGSSIDLLVFTGNRTDIDEAMLLTEIRETIAKEMGDEFQPDRIAVFPLYPRFLSGTEVDHDWCREQYLTGGLSNRSRKEIFKCITHLRKCIFQKAAV